MNRILIVEDNEKNRRLARDILQHNGYVTTEAIDGETGVAMARSDLPDLVLMDIQLPGIDGFEALKRLRADPATAAIPVIAVTASVMTSDVGRIAEAGFDAYIPKPIRYASFLAKVRDMIARTEP